MKIRKYFLSLISLFFILLSLFPEIIFADSISITPISPDVLNVSSQAEYRYRGTEVIGCSSAGLKKVRGLEWHTNPIPDTLRVRRTSFGNWLRFTFKNESENEIDKRLTFFSTNLSRIESCAFSAEGKFEQGLYLPNNDQNFRKFFVSVFPSFSIRLRPGEVKTFYYYIYSTEDITYVNFPVKLQDRKTLETGESLRKAFTIFIFLLTAFSSALAVGYWLRRKRMVFLTLNVHIFVSIFSFYFLHVKSFILFWGITGRIVAYPYFLFQAASYISLFPFLLSAERIWNGKQKFNWFSLPAPLFGFSFLLIPISEPVFEYRILILSASAALTIYFFIKFHKPILRSGKPVILAYLFSWVVFFLLNLAKSLYHFDFYPYNEIAIFSFVFFAPFHSILAGFCLYLITAEEDFDAQRPRLGNRKSTVSSLEVGSLVSRIRALIQEDKIYLKNSLKEEHLAKELGIGIHQLSEIINVEFKTNFPSLMNQYRIQEAKKLLLLAPKLSITEVRVRSGFSSKSAFNLEFKKLTGLSPNGYRQSNDNRMNEENSLNELL
ncbi:DNA-binding helix-turn-helix protein [Leptospira fainei serovar Hurstbridge str. BUT 6]|uniref:DNA-binding helix-turn-helix protein n=1 Tax=Leptospira fainei serovar Hurstbridge str. BUT 6 TaxID=1193011 RepID=S3VY34_9LEPT|nr:helix-turn-helix domain-containing protein [Leptospira fainei]EPG73012.1 DNA-binding helix-turn-helix protein [Leptospira fainei serovar Hurstbridge str. BUT 6]